MGPQFVTKEYEISADYTFFISLCRISVNVKIFISFLLYPSSKNITKNVFLICIFYLNFILFNQNVIVNIGEGVSRTRNT